MTRSTSPSTPPPDDATVGALFLPGSTSHYCTAATVHSPGHDLLVTAAHCVFGTGVGVTYAPGYSDRGAPDRTWVVVRAYVDPRWPTTHAPDLDVAFLQVARQPRSGQLIGPEDLVGGHSLGTAPAAGQHVAVTGYTFGHDDRPVSCTAAVYYSATWPTFDCAGFADGTSGSPWISAGAVVGVIGGLHEGGCTATTSFSAPFGAAVTALYQRAERGGPGDTPGVPPGDGC